MNNNTSIGVVGGQTYPVYETKPPIWFENFSNYFAIGKQWDSSGDITDVKGWIWGAGSVYRKEIFDKLEALNFAQFLSDRKGSKLTSGGDIELCYIVKILGYKIWYDEGLNCAHYMPRSRYDINKFHQLCIANGRNHDILRTYRSKDSIQQSFFIKKGLKNLYRACRMKYSISKQDVSTHTIEYFELIGEIYGSINFLMNYNSITANLSRLRKIAASKN